MKSTFQDMLQQHTTNCVTSPAEMKEKAHHEHHTGLFSLWENTHYENDFQVKNKLCKTSNKLGHTKKI